MGIGGIISEQAVKKYSDSLDNSYIRDICSQHPKYGDKNISALLAQLPVGILFSKQPIYKCHDFEDGCQLRLTNYTEETFTFNQVKDFFIDNFAISLFNKTSDFVAYRVAGFPDKVVIQQKLVSPFEIIAGWILKREIESGYSFDPIYKVERVKGPKTLTQNSKNLALTIINYTGLEIKLIEKKHIIYLRCDSFSLRTYNPNENKVIKVFYCKKISENRLNYVCISEKLESTGCKSLFYYRLRWGCKPELSKKIIDRARIALSRIVLERLQPSFLLLLKGRLDDGSAIKDLLSDIIRNIFRKSVTLELRICSSKAS